MPRKITAIKKEKIIIEDEVEEMGKELLVFTIKK